MIETSTKRFGEFTNNGKVRQLEAGVSTSEGREKGMQYTDFAVSTVLQILALLLSVKTHILNVGLYT